MQENESIEIKLTGDVTDVISSTEEAAFSIEKTENAVQHLTTQLDLVRNALKGVSLQLFDDDVSQQLDFAERNINRLLSIKKSIDTTLGSESKQSNTALFNYLLEYTQKRVADINDSVGRLNELQKVMSGMNGGGLQQAMNRMYAGLKMGLKNYAEVAVAATGTQHPIQLVDGFMKTSEYKNIVEKTKASAGNNSVFTDDFMKKYLASISSVVIPAIANNHYVDWEGTRRTIHRVQDLLPKSFANIKLGKEITPTRHKTDNDFTVQLSAAEQETLKQIILQNQYVAREAEAAKLIRKTNGNIYFNQNATRGHVNAFAGGIAHLFSVGSVGMPMYGIDDIYDPKNLKSIMSKNNKSVSNARKVADLLHTQYGAWLNPGYYDDLPVPSEANTAWMRAGQVKAAGRKDRMQFLELTTKEIDDRGNVAYASGEPTWTPVVQSEYQNYLSKQKGATPFTHNGINKNEIFIKLPNDEFVAAVGSNDIDKQNELKNEVARVIGTMISHEGRRYSFSGLTKTHAVFTDEELKKQIADKGFFANGQTVTNFTDYEDFAKAASYNRAQRVEGENIAELYGVDVGNLKIAVADMKKFTGIDGQNFISSKLVPEGFQGRAYRGKATYSPLNIQYLFERDKDLIDPTTGNLIYKGAGVNGSDLVITPDTDIIEDVANIKTDKTILQGMTPEQIAEIRRREYAEYGLFAKTSYDAANTQSRYISAQLANTMAFTPEARRYFAGVYMSELASLEDPGMVIKKLFDDDDALSMDVKRDHTLLNSKEAKARIASYKDSLNAHIGRGDVLLPEGAAQYAMIAAWAPDVFDKMAAVSRGEITSDQARASLNDDVAFFLDKNQTLGLGRNPATINGNVEVLNKAGDEYFERLANALGLDKNALYVNPASVILKRLQGADEDGDTALVYALKHSKNKAFSEVMAATLVATAERYNKIREMAGVTDEELQATADSRTRKVVDGQKTYSLTSPEDLSTYWAEDQKSVMNMGASSAVTRNALSMNMTPAVAKAILLAERAYDINTVRGKKGVEYITSAEEFQTLAEGAPIASIVNWAMKSRTGGENDIPVSFDQNEFYNNYADKIAKSNFASINNPTEIQHALAIWYAKQVNGYDVSGGFDWDSIFENMPNPFEKNSAAGQLRDRLNDLRRQQIKGEFLIFDDDLLAELQQRSTEAYSEITNEVNSDSSIANEDRNKEIQRRYKLAGGDIYRHIFNRGLTNRNIAADPETAAEISSLIDVFGSEGLYGHAIEYESTYSQAKIERNNQKLTESKEKKAQLEAEEREHAARNAEEISRLKAEIEELKARDNKDQDEGSFDAPLIAEIANKEKRLSELQHSRRDEIAQVEAEIKTAEMYQRQAYDFYQAQDEYNRVLSAAQDFSKDLWKSRASKEAYINDTSKADLYYSKQSGIADAYLRQLDSVLDNFALNLDPTQQEEINRLRKNITEGVKIDFADKSVYNAKKLSESLANEENITEANFDKSTQKVNEYADAIKEASEYYEKLIELANKAAENNNEKDAEFFSKKAEETKKYIEEAEASRIRIRDNLYAKDSLANDKVISEIDRYTRDRKKRYSRSAYSKTLLSNENEYAWYEDRQKYLNDELATWNNRKNELESSNEINTSAYNTATKQIDKLTAALANCKKEMKGLSGLSGKANAAVSVIGQTAANVIGQFGRRLTHQAIQEIQNFVVSFDAAMTEIQMVTLKTDDEISVLGESLVDKAVELRASVDEITTAATALYRQGLSDAEVDERLDDVIKFSKTAKINATDSIKLATVALNNSENEELDVERVFDVVSALGDSAATEASQITKGLQKSLSAANAIGVSFEELVAMLTVVTSKTQLSGNVAGTTMRNVFSRMARFGDADSRYASEVQFLKSYGIDMFKNGDMRNPTDILAEIGSLWESFEDDEKNNIAYALGGTEQFSNIMALMQGFSETDESGQNLMKKYMDLANSSNGIVDKKYQHQIESLDGAITNLRSTFDMLVESAESTGPVVDFIDAIADGVAGFAEINKEADGALTTFVALSTVLVGAIGLFKTNPYLLAAMGIVTGIVGAGKLYHDYKEASKPETYSDRIDYSNQVYDNNKNKIDTASEINAKRTNGESISEYEMKELQKILISFEAGGLLSLDGLVDSSGNAITSINQLANSAEATAKALDNVEDVVDNNKKQRELSASIIEANNITGSVSLYEKDKKEYEDQYAVSTKGQAFIDDVKQYNMPSDTSESFALNLLRRGVLDDVASVMLDGKTLGSLRDENGLYDEKTFLRILPSAIPTYATRLNPATGKREELFEPRDKGLMSTLLRYAGSDSLNLLDEEYISFGEYNRDRIANSLLGRDSYFAESGLINLLAKGLEKEINLEYETLGDKFNAEALISRLFYSDGKIDIDKINTFAKNEDPSEYDRIMVTTAAETGLDPVTLVSRAMSGAKISRKDADYDSAWVAASDILRTAQGDSATRANYFASQFANMEDFDEMIQAKGSDDLVNAWVAMAEIDENGKYVLNPSDEEMFAFESALAGMSDRTKLMGQYRPATTLAASVKKTFDKITSEGVDPYSEWQNISEVSAFNELAQKEFINIVGEELTNRILNKQATSDELAYARNLIDTYSATARVAPGYQQKNVQAMISGFSGPYSEQMAQYSSIDEQLRAYEKGLHSYNQVIAGLATDSDYSQISTTTGLNVDRVKQLAQTNEGREELNKLLAQQISNYSDILSQVLLSFLPEDALVGLSEDADIDKLLEVFKKSVSEDVYNLIETVLRTFNISYNGKDFDVPVDADGGFATPWQSISATRSEYNAANRDDELLKYLKAAVTSDIGTKEYLLANTPNEDWDTFFGANSMLAAAFASYGNNEGIIDQKQLLALINEAMYKGSKSSEYYDVAASAILGSGYEDGDVDWASVLSTYETLRNTDIGESLIGSMEETEEGAAIIEMLNDALQEGAINAEDATVALEHYNTAMGSRTLNQLTKYDKANQKIVNTFEALAAGGSDAASAYDDLLTSTRNLGNANWALNQYKSGARTEKVTNILANQFGLDQKTLEKASKADAEAMIQTMEMAYDEQFETLKKNFDYNFSDISDYVAQAQANTGGEFNVQDYVVNGKVNISALLKAFSEAGVIVDQTWAAVVKAMAASATFAVNADGDQVKLDIANIAGTGSGYYGGGGGSKKSSADKLVERLGHGKSLYEHQIKMVQYEQTRYQNADELTNYGKMLEEELAIEESYLPVLESNLAALRDELFAVKEGSEDWYKLRDAILEAEEQYKDINNTIAENKDKLKENQQAILKLHTDLESMVVEEIELRINSEKEMLDGTVSMQDIVLNAIKQRYQDEWDLIKKDIDKKKEALEEEKNLIDERLDARKEAEDEAAKYEELAELKKQLAAISMDSTRTKDAAALRESITELEKEIGWDIAEKQAESEKNAIQDQIDAYDDYLTQGEEDLDVLLSDANNFAEEVNGVMKLNQTELFDWLKQNVKEYSDSLNEAQMQMVQSWEATYKQMLGITDTYWDEVNAILSSKDVFLEYMKQSNEYIYASEDERAQLLYQWEEAYNAWKSAKKNDASYNHTDSGLGDYSGSEYTGSSSGSSGGSSGGSSSTPQYTGTPNDAGFSKDQYSADNYKIVGASSTGSQAISYTSDLEAAKQAAKTASRDTGHTFIIYDADGNAMYVYREGELTTSNATSSSTSGNSLLQPTDKEGGHWYYKVTNNGEVLATDSGYSTRKLAQDAAKEIIKKHGLSGSKYSTYYYKKGGIADFTGLAWLDGSPAEPERILSAEQTRSFDNLVQIMDDLRTSGVSTEALRGMLNWSTMVNVPNALSYIGSDAYQGNSSNIGDIYVNITEAQISDDRDIEELANIVGEKFVKEIGKQGFNTSRYNF